MAAKDYSNAERNTEQVIKLKQVEKDSRNELLTSLSGVCDRQENPGYIVSYHFIPVVFNNPHARFSGTTPAFEGTFTDNPRKTNSRSEIAMPRVLDVPDTYLKVPVLLGSDPITYIHTGYETATALVADYLNSLSDSDPSRNSAPGIGVFRSSSITLSELSALFDRQVNYALYLVEAADVLFSRDKKDSINHVHRAAARFLGKPVRWNSQINSDAFKECISCRSMIHSEALVCSQCQSPQDMELAKSWLRVRSGIPTPAVPAA